MQSAGPGTLLGGRYTLRRRLMQGRDVNRWSAHDTTLEREVALTIIDSDHPNRAGVVDAARRAAGVEDTRLVRILDVGTQDGSSFIVEEAMSGSESLAAILLQGPLPAEEARRIAGETARGLETAGQRGLHHLRLTPHSLLIAPDGAIRVSGVAVAAAIDGPGEQEPDPATASRRDAVCIVAVTYAALTSRWPLDEQIADIESAPRVAGGVAAPSEIIAGIPGDLDSLCRTTLNEGAGPATPGDFANRISPWSRERVHRGGVEPTAVLHQPSWDGGGDLTDGAPASAGDTELTVAIPTHDVPVKDPSTGSGAASPMPDRSGQVTGPTDGDRVAGAGATAPSSVGSAPASAQKAAVVGGILGFFTRGTADKATDKGNREVRLGQERMTLPDAFSGQSDNVEPPLPMLPASTAHAPSGAQSRIAVMVVITFLALSLLVAYYGLRDPASDIAADRAAVKPTVTAIAPRATVPAAPAPKSGATEPAGGQPIAILSATGFDPEGDRTEKNGQAARAYDEDPATMWTSEGYGSADFGRLKNGVGVLLDLGQPTSAHQVTMDLASEPVDVTVYAATQPSLEGATVIGTASAASGRIELKAASAMPEGQYVVVWFTKLAPDGGLFRASISEIALT